MCLCVCATNPRKKVWGGRHVLIRPPGLLEEKSRNLYINKYIYVYEEYIYFINSLSTGMQPALATTQSTPAVLLLLLLSVKTTYELLPREDLNTRLRDTRQRHAPHHLPESPFFFLYFFQPVRSPQHIHAHTHASTHACETRDKIRTWPS